MTQKKIRERKSSFMKVALFSAHNIDQLSVQERQELEQIYLTAYKNSVWADTRPESKEWYDSSASEKWFTDTQSFYLDLVKKGGSEVVLALDTRSQEVIAALFTVNGKTFLENADENSRLFMEGVMQKMGANPEKTLYIGELFVNPKYRGVTGGAAIMKMALELKAEMRPRGIEHVISWTLDRKDNIMIRMSQKIGLQEARDDKIVQGIDVLNCAHTGMPCEYIKSDDGPALYFNGTADQICDFIDRFAHRN